jgi:hypothetical protein
MLDALKCTPLSWHKDCHEKENAVIYHNAVNNKKASSPRQINIYPFNQTPRRPEKRKKKKVPAYSYTILLYIGVHSLNVPCVSYSGPT